MKFCVFFSVLPVSEVLRRKLNLYRKEDNTETTIQIITEDREQSTNCSCVLMCLRSLSKVGKWRGGEFEAE